MANKSNERELKEAFLRSLGLDDGQDYPWQIEALDKLFEKLGGKMGTKDPMDDPAQFTQVQAAINRTLEALQPLTPDQRARVLRLVAAYYDEPGSASACRCTKRGPSHDCPIHGR